MRQDTPRWFDMLVAEIRRGLGWYNLDYQMNFYDDIHETVTEETDLKLVLFNYLNWLLVDEEHGVLGTCKPGSKAYLVVQQVAAELQRGLAGDYPTFEEWVETRDAVYQAWLHSSNYSVGVACEAAYAASLDEHYPNAADRACEFYSIRFRSLDRAGRAQAYLRQARKLVRLIEEINLSANNSQIEMVGAA